MLTILNKEELIEIRMRKTAEAFVDVYEKNGEYAALEWAEDNIGENNYEDFKPYVRGIFFERGYTFKDEVNK